MLKNACRSLVFVFALCAIFPFPVLHAQQGIQNNSTLTAQLLKEDPATLANEAAQHGDPERGAMLFFRPEMTCVKCHFDSETAPRLGPDLARPKTPLTDQQVLQSLLDPSRRIEDGYQTIQAITMDGRSITGLLVQQRCEEIVLRDPDAEGAEKVLAMRDLEEWRITDRSIMPDGLVNLLASRQQFLDLARYLIEINRGGPQRELQLRPPLSLFAAPRLPDYETRLDHAGLIADWGPASLERGEKVYQHRCASCHGTHQRPGSLPTSLRFAEGKFKNGNDPLQMYRTITGGFGMMVGQHALVPRQKYDVIHYIREAYLRRHNPSQYFPVDDQYLAALPKGNERGPEPSEFAPWELMDYGSALCNTLEVGRDGTNFAHKGIAVRLDDGPGGVARGRYWMLYDHDTLRMAAAWSGRGFIDWNGIHFNDQHEVHPRIVGDLHVANPTGPGWARPGTFDFADARVPGRDGRMYGPLPRDWAHFHGLYYFGNKAILAYRVGDTSVLEMPGMHRSSDEGSETTPLGPLFTRSFHIGPRSQPMVLQVAYRPGAALSPAEPQQAAPQRVAIIGPPSTPDSRLPGEAPWRFDGQHYAQLDDTAELDMTQRDFSIAARIKTRRGGTVFCKTASQGPWVADGKALFVRDGRLVFDIGWVGAVRSEKTIDDGQWHDVVLVWRQADGSVQLFIDGQVDGEGTLKPRAPVSGHVVRIGFGAEDFPESQSCFEGEISQVRFFDRPLDAAEVVGATRDLQRGLIADWDVSQARPKVLPDQSRNGRHAKVVDRVAGLPAAGEWLLATVSSELEGRCWRWSDLGDLRLEIPAGNQTLRFTLYLASTPTRETAEQLARQIDLSATSIDLAALQRGGPMRWPEILPTRPELGADDGPLAVDRLAHPADNPWSCRMRFTGLDFFPDGRRMAVCSWDGSVWLVDGVDTPETGLSWQRIAAGLFQPLGLKIVDETIYVSCRDQIARLHDYNGDGEIDFCESFNSDHQVTEHFHEFAMGLQTDAQGNFYYAKGARHAKPALVPHHGTLLRVRRDGTATDVVATGFRAPNGVLVNDDGSFFVTDQEGHWLPKNRINLVRPGEFFGNMWGYTSVTDPSDQAMQQPLCWITNAFDRSPGEMLWVTSAAWGPLQGGLLNLSYGYGKIFIVPHETINGQIQGGMSELPIAPFPTGVMRGRFHPGNGQLYCCGMFAWAGNQQQPGGLYRVRYTGRPLHVPITLHAHRGRLTLAFSGPLDRTSAELPENYSIKTWSLRRSAQYGSDHFEERFLQIERADLGDDARTVQLWIPDLSATQCMEIKYALKTADGEPLNSSIHNTIHALAPLEE